MRRIVRVGSLLLLTTCWMTFTASTMAQILERSIVPTNFVPLSVAIGDFNNDGVPDLAIASVNQPGPEVQIYLGRGDGTFRSPATYDVGTGTGPIAVADLNGDGNLDLVVVNGACPNDVCYDSVSVSFGNGDGTFGNPLTYSTPPGPSAVILGDFNGDGKLDIATLNRSDYTATCDCVGILLGNGDGSFQEPAILTSLTGYPEALVTGYFGSSKNLDLAVTLGDISSSTVQILPGNGDGTFQIGPSYELAPEAQSIIAADFRNNGKTDLAVGEFEGRGVAVLLGNGNGTFKEPVVYKAGTPLGVAAADMNGDGILDLIAVTPGDTLMYRGFTEILLGKGDGTFQAQVSYQTGQFPEALAIGDFNGDHKPDITVVDQVNESDYILLNTGAVSFSPTNLVEFPRQRHGTTSKPQTVTLTNSGKAELKISSMKPTGPFGMTSTCGDAVAAGGNCTISVTFSPKTKGEVSGTVSIDDSASSKPQVIALGGTGT
jgi:FG-GAP-like repeat/Abnormal spindle-like microcephaly-assoc'd, ASPM-SPD-2-Hydin